MAEITIGSDPEFIILNSCGGLVSANEFFTDCTDCQPCEECGRDKDHPEVCDDCGEVCRECSHCTDEVGECIYCRSCSDDLETAEIGCDGYEEVGELRPMESSSPLIHHANIKELIHSIKLPKGYKLVAGTRQRDCSIGGHIHIGYEDNHVDPQNLAYYLSYYCGIPLKRIERKTEVKRRGWDEDDYGYYGIYDEKDYGMEWRMPASWLVSSKIAKASLCLADVVARDYIDELKCGIDHEKYLEENEYHALVTAPNINNIIQEIKKMKGYKEYRRQIKPLFDMVEKNHVWYTNTNFKELW